MAKVGRPKKNGPARRGTKRYVLIDLDRLVRVELDGQEIPKRLLALLREVDWTRQRTAITEAE